jgi:iron complex outermembrane receptor protein
METGAHSLLGAVNFVSGISLIRRMDGTTLTGVSPQHYSGTTCHYGGNNFDNVPSRSVQGATPTATNGRDLYINRYPGCAISKWVTFDVGYTYTGFKNLSLSLNIQNFTDEQAPYDPTAGQLGYNAGLHNPYGRYFTVSASYKFY